MISEVDPDFFRVLESIPLEPDSFLVPDLPAALLAAILEREPDFLRVLGSRLACFTSLLFSAVLLVMSDKDPDFRRDFESSVDVSTVCGVVLLVVAERVREEVVPRGPLVTALLATSFVLMGVLCFTNVDCFLRLSEVVEETLLFMTGGVLTGEWSADRGRGLECGCGFELGVKSKTHAELGDC